MTTAATDIQLLRRRALGWSLRLDRVDPDGDLGVDLVLHDDRSGLETVEGMDNLSQSLSIALTTLLGSDTFNGSFGFDGLNALVEETHPLLARERIRVAVIRVLERDPRVRRIVDVKLLDGRLEPGRPDGEGVRSPADTRTFSVKVAFETITGEQATVDLREVGPNV